MRKKERYEKILAWFRENRPVAETELHYETPFQLLIAVILSAQCTEQAGEYDCSTVVSRFPYPGSSCCQYTGSDIRIYP